MIFLCIFLCYIQSSNAQVAINTDATLADPSAIFDVKSTDKGVLIPRMTKAQRNLISIPAAGLLVFQSAPDSIGFYYYNGTKWSLLLNSATSDSTFWKTNGNSLTNAATNFLGTTDANDLVIKTNNVERMHLMSTGSGFVGLGTSTPNSTLHVNGTIAVGVTLGVAGGTVASPTLFNLQKSYIGLSPAGTNVYYQLPSPSVNIGRVYYIRNNDASVVAQLGTVSGLICPGSAACLAGGSYYGINGASAVKTVIAISDGINWTVGKLD